MRIRRRPAPSIDDLIREADQENERRLAALEGNKSCAGVGCSSTTGIACSYVDRRGRQCGTAWCPAHRELFQFKIFCPLHANTMRGIKAEFAESVHPDIDNRIPAMVGWIARAAEDDLVATMRRVAGERGETLVSDPVQLLFRTVERVRTWERCWKSCSAGGPGCRVSIGIEEKNPDEVIIRVNGHIISRMETPWPALERTKAAAVEAEIFKNIVMPVSFALDQWQQGIPIDGEKPFVPSNASAALEYIGGMIFEEEGLDMSHDVAELTAQPAEHTDEVPSAEVAAEVEEMDVEVTAHPVFEQLLEPRVPAAAGAARRRARSKIQANRRIVTRPPRRR